MDGRDHILTGRKAAGWLLLAGIALTAVVWAVVRRVAPAMNAALLHDAVEMTVALLSLLVAAFLAVRHREGMERNRWLVAALVANGVGAALHLGMGGLAGALVKILAHLVLAVLLVAWCRPLRRIGVTATVVAGLAVGAMLLTFCGGGPRPRTLLGCAFLLTAGVSGTLLLAVAWHLARGLRRQRDPLVRAMAVFSALCGATSLLAWTVVPHTWWFWGWHLLDLVSLLLLSVSALADILAALHRLSHVSEDLVQSESRFRALTEHSADIIFILGRDGTYSYVSPAATRISGLPEDQLLGRRPGGFIHPEDRRRVMDGIRRARNRPGEQVPVGHVHVRHADGHWLVLEGIYTSMMDVPGVEGIVLNYRDVTEQVRAAEALQESQRRLTTLIGNLPGMVYRCDADPDLTLLYVSPGCEALLGYTADELTGERSVTAPEFIHPEDFPRVRTAIWEAVEKREPFQLQYRVTHRNGELRWVWEHGRGVFDEEGRLTSVEGYMLDVTDRVQAEQELRRTQFSINHASDAVYWIGADGSLVDINETACNVLGYTRDELLSMTIFDISHDLDPNRWRETWEMVKRQGSVLIEGIHVTKSGRKFVVEVSSNYQEFDGQAFHCCFARDITERKEAEEAIRRLNQELEARVERRTRELRRAQQQLVTAEKMAALGSLVAGVAHEINTPLGIGVTAATYLHREVEEYGRRYREGTLRRSDFEALLATLEETATLLESNLTRAADLVQNFKQVSVDRATEPLRRFHLREYLEELLASLKPRLEAGGHEVVLACPDDLELEGYPGAISQIITNLVINSVVHGFEGRQGGHIGITVTRHGDWVRLRYADDGRGMSADDASRVFDPFFTTRRGRGGSGLGMHIVYNLVTQVLGGRIELETEPERGAIFQIDFPRSAAGPVENGPDGKAAPELAGLPVSGGIRA